MIFKPNTSQEKNPVMIRKPLIESLKSFIQSLCVEVKKAYIVKYYRSSNTTISLWQWHTYGTISGVSPGKSLKMSANRLFGNENIHSLIFKNVHTF